MNSQSILEESQALNAYDDKSFIKEDHSHQLHPNDPTRIAIFPAETDRGTNFEPFHVETVEIHCLTDQWLFRSIGGEDVDVFLSIVSGG